jgi:hypothetical protein
VYSGMTLVQCEDKSAIMKIISLITGLVRDEERAINLVSQLARRKADGLIDEIIFSTWANELDPYGRLRDKLKLNKVHTIESPRQQVTFQESHQKIPILIALAYLDDNSFVTRHRFDRVTLTDKYFNYIANVREYGAKRSTISWSPISFKISVSTAALDLPFFISDLIFAGMKQDILKLAHINPLLQLYWSPHINQELSFYASLFSLNFDLIYDYISTYPGPASSEYFKEVQFKSDFFIRALGFYYSALNNCFDIGFEYSESKCYDKVPVTLEETFSYKSRIQSFGIDYFSALGHAYMNSNLFCNLVLGSAFNKSVLYDKLLASIASFNSLQSMSCTTCKITSGDALSYWQDLSNNGFDVPVPRGLSQHSDGRISFYAAPLFNSTDSLKRNTSHVVMGDFELV